MAIAVSERFRACGGYFWVHLYLAALGWQENSYAPLASRAHFSFRQEAHSVLWHGRTGSCSRYPLRSDSRSARTSTNQKIVRDPQCALPTTGLLLEAGYRAVAPRTSNRSSMLEVGDSD